MVYRPWCRLVLGIIPHEPPSQRRRCCRYKKARCSVLLVAWLVFEEALAWKCVPRGQCGFFELKFMTFSLRFFVTFFSQNSTGKWQFRVACSSLFSNCCFQCLHLLWIAFVGTGRAFWALSFATRAQNRRWKPEPEKAWIQRCLGSQNHDKNTYRSTCL